MRGSDRHDRPNGLGFNKLREVSEDSVEAGSARD